MLCYGVQVGPLSFGTLTPRLFSILLPLWCIGRWVLRITKWEGSRLWGWDWGWWYENNNIWMCFRVWGWDWGSQHKQLNEAAVNSLEVLLLFCRDGKVLWDPQTEFCWIYFFPRSRETNSFSRMGHNRSGRFGINWKEKTPALSLQSFYSCSVGQLSIMLQYGL